MGGDRVQVDAKSSSTLTPGFKPEESSFLKQRYQDQVEAETPSPTAEKQFSTSGQSTPTPPPLDPPPLSHSFGQMSVLPIQAKLTIGQPNDKYEQEADRVAEQVMRMPDPRSPAAAITRPVRSPVIQRLCSECDEKLQRQPLEEEKEEGTTVQSKRIAGLTTPIIQRQGVESEEEEEDTLQMKPLVSQITSLIQRQSESSEVEDEEIVQTKPVSYQVSPLVHGLVQREPDQTAAADDPQAQLRQMLIEFWRDQPQISESLSLSGSQQKRLRNKIANPTSYKDQDDMLKDQLTSLKRRERIALAKEVLNAIMIEIQGRLAAHINQLPGLIKTATESKLREYAEHMAAREEYIAQNRAQLSRSELREHRDFPLIFKYIWRHVISRQICSPRQGPYTLASDYAKPLGLTDKDAVFPDLHTEALVTALKKVPVRLRLNRKGECTRSGPLFDKVLTEVLGTLEKYTSRRMETTPTNIEQEYAKLGINMKRNIESDLAGFFAARAGLINKFGDPSDPAAALLQARKYYDSLQAAEFLKGHPGKKVGGTVTLVHPKMKEALDKSEQYIIKQGWLEEVLATTRKYWSTNIRENRNAPQRLSQHSFGMAIDINPEDNPNLARMSKSNWRFVEEMLGETLFKLNEPLLETIRKGDDPEATLAAVEKIRAQSDAYKNLFENEENLRKRLAEILLDKGLMLSDEKLSQLLDLAKNLVALPRKTKKQKKAHKVVEKEIADLIFANLWAQNPMKQLEEIHGPEQALTQSLLKLLQPKIKKQTHLDAHKDMIVEQIKNPADKASRQTRNLMRYGLFRKPLIAELRAISVDERAVIAETVVTKLQLPLERKKTESRVKNIARFITQSFSILKGTRKKDGGKIRGGKGMSNIAAQGFSNLSSKLITALTVSHGGNLKWLGVHNQDMHHFELKVKPPLPKASAQSQPGLEVASSPPQ